MRLTYLHFLVVSLACPGLLQARPCVAATELEQRAEIQGAAERSFLSSDFVELERTASAYRQEKARTASGLWKLTVFYAGIDKAMDDFAKEQGDLEAYGLLEEKTKEWIAKYPDSSTGYIAHSMVLVRRAWAHRGNDYASNVSEAEWAWFRKYIAAARANLQEHKKIAAGDPKWYEEMLLIARAENWNQAEFHQLLNEAVDREPVFYQTYFSALQYLLPKWHGSLEEIEDFAQYAVGKTKHLEGQGMYARIYWYASQTEFENDIFNKSLADWQQMKAGFEDVIGRYPDAWNLNNYARFACMARDKPKTAELLERIGTSAVIEAWPTQSVKDQCANWASLP
jgi:hypothetical protein